jgi:DNA excision repair protein ERCC-8
VNGIVWTDDGRHIVTCGHDERIRVWDSDTGANTLANFGPMVRNSGLLPRIPVLPPPRFLPLEKDLLFYPNGNEILGYEMFEGKLVSRLRRQERQQLAPGATAAKGQRNVVDRISSLAWRAHDVELYSAHVDGGIVAWKPRTEEDVDLDEDEEREKEEADQSKKRKRDLLDNIYNDLTKRRVTFGGAL